MGSWCSNPTAVQGSTVHLFDNVNRNIAIKISKSPVSSILMLRDKKKTYKPQLADSEAFVLKAQLQNEQLN